MYGERGTHFADFRDRHGWQQTEVRCTFYANLRRTLEFIRFCNYTFEKVQ
jgi:hypothetical protein